MTHPVHLPNVTSAEIMRLASVSGMTESGIIRLSIHFGLERVKSLIIQAVDPRRFPKRVKVKLTAKKN